jgi:FKBP-type peptidyl-prolyl cis-trans isomerase
MRSSLDWLRPLLLVVGTLSATGAGPLGCKRAPDGGSESGPSGADASGGARASIPPPPDVAAPPPTAVRTASGLATVVLTPGTGLVHPTPFDFALFRFVGWKSSGELFGASSLAPLGPPVRSRVNDGGIPGLSEGLQLMVVGEKRRLWIPARLASAPSAEPRPSLVMDVELVALTPAPSAPQVPEDAAAPPKSAQRTPSGLYWRFVAVGSHGGPKPDSVVIYNATIWTRSGKLMASSIPEGEPEKGIVSGLPPPLDEAIQLMAVGDTIRIWFDEKQGAPPGGPYVADLELISFD